MLNVVKTTNVINKGIAFLYGLTAATVLAFLPVSAGAQCSTGWDAGGDHVIRQKGTYPFNVTFHQRGRVITGTAYATVERGDGGVKTIRGPVDGTIDGDSFRIQIFWNNQQTGVYIATVLPSGRLDGEAYEKSTPNVRPTWHIDGVLKCAPPLRVTPKPIKSSGKAKQTPTPSPPPTPPFITASQVIIPTPNHPFGSVYLGWDAGPDHPNVEVFVSVNNGPETPAFSMDYPRGHPLFKQPKATIEMKLPRNSGQYKYVLKAAGKTLSTTFVVVVR